MQQGTEAGVGSPANTSLNGAEIIREGSPQAEEPLARIGRRPASIPGRAFRRVHPGAGLMLDGREHDRFGGYGMRSEPS